MTATRTWRALLAETEARLAAAGVASPGVDARRLVERASGLEGAELVLGLDRPAKHRGVAHLDAMVERRAGGEPLQYVVGRWGFRSLDLLVDARALIPRPETEQVVDVALAELDRVAGPRPSTVADLGTGSGAIALSVAKEVVTAQVWASDLSADALALARANLAGLGRPAARVRLVEGDWFDALPPDLAGRLDLVIANPPYVAEADDLPAEVADWEPPVALVAGPTGREHLERLVEEAPAWLSPTGSLVLELAPVQAPAMVAAASSAGFADVEVTPDLAGRQRILVARSSPHPPRTLSRWPSGRRPTRQRTLDRAVAALRSGAAVVVPTDTVYGLAADPRETAALFAIKHRPPEVALPVLVADLDQALALAADDLPPAARRLMARWWPGGLTVVVPRRPGLGLDLGGPDDLTIGLRLPAHPVPVALAAAAGPLAVTSANRHGQATPATVADVVAQLGGEAPLALDGGRCEGKASTVVSCVDGGLRVLREGVIPTVDVLASAES